MATTKKSATKRTAANKTGGLDLSKPIPRKGLPTLHPSPERGSIPFEKIQAAVKEVLAARGALKKE